MREPCDFFRRHAGKFLWAGFLAYTLLFSSLSFFNYRHYLFGDWDLALYNQVFRGFLTGHPFMTLADVPYLGVHAEITMLVFLPFYVLVPHPVTLLVLQSVSLALAIFPLFALARRVTGEAAALFFCAAYLLYPAVGYVNLNEFHPECLLPFIQLSLVYYFTGRDLKKFLLFMFLCLFAKENMPFVVMAFGILAAVQRRSKAWVIWPLAAGGAWFFIYMKMIFPGLSQGQIKFDFIYSHMGTSMPSVLMYMATHPLQIIFWLTRVRPLVYLYQIFAPLGFMSLASPGLLLPALPILAQHLLSRRMTETNIAFYYSAEFLGIIFAAGVFGFRRVFDFFGESKRKLFLFFLILCVVCSAGLSPQVLSLIGLSQGFGADAGRTRSYQTLIKAFPGDASVVATFGFLPELSRRPVRLDSFHKILTGENYPGRRFMLTSECSYALIDFNDEKTFTDFFCLPGFRQNLKNFFSGGTWGARMALGNAVLFKKNTQGIPLLSLASSRDVSEEPVYVFDDDLALLKCEVSRFVIDGQDGVRLVFSWSVPRPTEVPYGFRLMLVDGLNEVTWKDWHVIGYRIYPTDEWKAGEVVGETFQFLLPRDPGPGPWRLCLVPVNRSTGARCRVTGGQAAAAGQKEASFPL